ncbi:bifunctional demethylmenaquinone methyltransferase/2-methoxy-6-polyprenyl-1,4-benzoquinol methylase UbiE [uncultured Muribaculum sp.]|uniref:bifunctional demethylmenaquinone methyltransferase/2-methoxy-6-polyprenyl-1,4-benzoquinol methylase UbiE n=5 Tax=uncultured Muribaculum sp. TaxID=1918613 RepID=UPI00266EC8EA|nr:bifunctional demethylmenaquinone methyltransferase/2-methoxy-6-polyprenyl-1,4-benzoquinol methylase UbiE [uncultured Muribaculum sp.]
MDIKAEKVNPYLDDKRPKTQQVRSMFNSIAPAYDVMNRMMTFGIDKLWRRKAVSMLKKHSACTGCRILDVATGTGDLALLLNRKLKPAKIIGIDISEKMIDIARQKYSSESKTENQQDVEFMTADCLNIPFSNESFKFVTVAYGVRNFEHLLQGYKEMFRVLEKGGQLCVIELSTPTGTLIKPFYKFYTRYIIPAVGRLISHDNRAYAYLPESIAAVPQGNEMTTLMREAGFSHACYHKLTFGVCTIYMATK